MCANKLVQDFIINTDLATRCIVAAVQQPWKDLPSNSAPIQEDGSVSSTSTLKRVGAGRGHVHFRMVHHDSIVK